MTNRRDVIKGGVAATTAFFGAGSAIASTGVKTASKSGQPAAGVPLHRVSDIIYDQRFPQAQTFASAAQDHGVTTHAIEGDVTSLWYHTLDAAWKEGPQTIAGMTGHGVLFVLERLAWEKGMTVAFRAQHEPNAKGGTDHRFEGPGSLISRAAQMDEDWPRAMAELVSVCPVKRGVRALLSTTTPDMGGEGATNETLVSWIIVPTGRIQFPRT